MIKKYPPPAANEIADYLSAHGFTFKRFQSGQGAENLKLEKAPCCGHEMSFSINSETGQFECWHSACGKRGNWVTLRRMLHDPLPTDKQVINFKQDCFEFFYGTNHKARGAVTRNKYPEVLAYLKGRGFSEDTLNAFRVSNHNQNSVRFPMFAFHNGEWIMQNARIIKVLNRVDKRNNWFEFAGGLTHLPIGNHLLEDSKDKIVYIFEGQWDVLTAYELGMRNVLSLPNGASSVKQEMLQYIPEDWQICICVDMDPSGDACAKKFFDIFNSRISRIHMPFKDLNEWYKEEPSLTKEMVLARRSYRIQPREKNYRKIKRHIKDTDKRTPLVDTPWTGLTNLMGGGLFGGEMTSFLAASGAGKTTFVNQLAVYIASQGIKIGVISLEGNEQQLDEKLDKAINGVVGEDDEKVIENLLISSLRGKLVSHAQIIEEVMVMVNEDHCKIVIVDNLDFITSGIDQKKYDTTAALMTIVVQANAHLIQVWQCNKNDPTKRVNSGSQKGESRIYQDSDNYMNMNHRIPDGKEIEMEKNREAGRGASLVNLKYDKNTNCYVEIDEDKANKTHRLKLLDLQN